MKAIAQVQDEIIRQINSWEARLLAIPSRILHEERNSQQRTIKQIVGHLIDSASNNTHRVIHLQYQPSPMQFPDYANLGMNDKWIALQHYQEEEWPLIVQLWKYSNLHFAHVIAQVSSNVDQAASATVWENVWISALDEEVSLRDMIIDYPRHLNLHLKEITDILEAAQQTATSAPAPGQQPIAPHQTVQAAHYANKLAFETDSWDLAELRERDPSVVIVDVRTEQAYQREHISGAISFPHRRMSFEATRQLDPGKTYITYCDGLGCNASTKGALKLAELGFTTRELIGGIDWWKRDGYPTDGTESNPLKSAACSSNSCGCR